MREYGNFFWEKKSKYKSLSKVLIVVILLSIISIVISLFELPEGKYILYDGVVNKETGSVCVVGRSGGKSVLYIFSAEGETILKSCLAIKTGRAQFNRVWVENNLFYLFNFKDKTIYSIEEDGTVSEVERLPSNDYWKQRDTWEEWSSDGSVYTLEHNGVTYEYNNQTYFSLKFSKENRKLNVVTSNGTRYELWNSSMTNEEFEAFPFQLY